MVEENEAIITQEGALAEFRKIAALDELADLFKNRDMKKETLQHLVTGRDKYTQKAEAKEAEAAQAEADVEAAIRCGEDAVKLSNKVKKLRGEAEDFYKLAEQADDEIPVAAKDYKDAGRMLYGKLNRLIGELGEKRQVIVQNQFDVLMRKISKQIEAWSRAQDQFKEECGIEEPFNLSLRIKASPDDEMYLRAWLL